MLRVMTLVLVVLAAGGAAADDSVSANREAATVKLYETLSKRLDRFAASLGAAAEPARPLVFGAELLTANAHRGEALLDTAGWKGNMLYLDRLQQMGVQGVTVQMAYPLLSDGFPRAEDYWAFYRRLSEEVRRRGMTLHIKNGPIFRESEFSGLEVDYDGLTLGAYFAARRKMAVRIARDLRPDYLTIANEPSTESRILGLRIDTAAYLRFVRQTLEAVDRSHTLVGAGSGTWDDIAFVRAFATGSAVDFIDLHIYPISTGRKDLLQAAAAMAELARAHGKRVIVGEFWLYKAFDRELAKGAAAPSIFGRDVFEFWSPLDQKMIETIAKFARAEGVEYVSPYWTKYLFAYLPADDRTVALSAGERLREADRAAVASLAKGIVSATGAAYSRLIAASQ